jgi:streptogramin lyase
MLHLPHDYCQLTRAIVCQNRNLIWFSNYSITGAALGLSRVVFTPDYFTNYPLPADKNDIPAVYAVARDSLGRIWVGMRGRYSVVQISPGEKATELKIPVFKTPYDPSTVRSLAVTPDGLWIGRFREVLVFYNFDTGEFTRHYPGSEYFRSIARNDEGNLFLWMSFGMIGLYNPELKKTEKLFNYAPPTPIYKILVDKNKTVWAGSNQSTLIRIDLLSEKSETFFLSEDNFNIEDICIGDNGDVWLALLGGGVCQFNQGTGKKVFYTTSRGLANNITYSILKDKTGNIWVSTNSGISRINPETGFIRTFGINEGLRINEFNSGASFIDKNGEFFMGGMGGLVSYTPDLINRSEMEAVDQRIIINEIKVSGETRHLWSL